PRRCCAPSDDPERVQVRINASALFMSFDYSAPAELFLAKRAKNGRGNYWRFSTAAGALPVAVDDLGTPKAFGAWLEVGDERFNCSEIQRLYETLRKPG